MTFAQAEIGYVVLIATGFVFAGAAVWAFGWAFRNGQMSNFARGATSIFDPDEPVGEVTDQTLAEKDEKTPPPAEQP